MTQRLSKMEAAARLDVSASTIDQMIHKGEIKTEDVQVSIQEFGGNPVVAAAGRFLLGPSQEVSGLLGMFLLVHALAGSYSANRVERSITVSAKDRPLHYLSLGTSSSPSHS